MRLLNNLLTDLDKRAEVQITNQSQLPEGAQLIGDTDGDGNVEWAADTDGDGRFDTFFEFISNLFS